MPRPRDELNPTRQSLLGRLRDLDDHESWRDFFSTYWQLLYSVAVRAGFNDAEAQDIVQETVICVARKLPEFTYDPVLGSFRSWLLRITHRRIVDHQRKRHRQPEAAPQETTDPDRTALVERLPDPAPAEFGAIWDEEWEKHLFHAALLRVRQRVDPKQFQIFDCYVLKGWPVRDVTRTLKVSAGQVYLARHRISALIEAEVRRIEKHGKRATSVLD